jgi:hypothetical protein
MLKNREALERGFQETAPSWEQLAKYLGDHGVMDGDGKRPTAIATRQAWYRARIIAKAKRTATPQTEPRAPPPSTVPFSMPALDPEEPGSDSEPEFKPATLKGRARKPPSPDGKS